ncbi:helix-turn-helix domain-containing protein [Streptomyces sp. NPDC051773]|uniref:helix-turn-helix domain-containing protein n=1 Tax=Streptomyces sp. NPDC051773 TaxID=3156682 RepID=UPI00342B2C16
MDTQNPSAPAHTQARITGKNHPRRRTHAQHHPSGVIHDNSRHTNRFTVIGNHLAQHQELSGLAIGLGVHIQSLPTGTPVDIKTLAARFPEGPTRIAAALRELETHGYLRRTRVRTESGRIVTRTVSCNQPGKPGDASGDGPGPEPHHAPKPPVERPAQPPARRAASAPQRKPARRALPAVPQPSYTSPALLQTATEVLAGLRRHDPRLILSATDTEHLAPGVVAWLVRDLTPTAVRHALTSDLPAEPLRRPAALLAHRLTEGLPPLPPFRAPETPPPVRYPVRVCTDCDLGYHGPDPKLCPGCAAKGRIPETLGAADGVPAK